MRNQQKQSLHMSLVVSMVSCAVIGVSPVAGCVAPDDDGLPGETGDLLAACQSLLEKPKICLVRGEGALVEFVIAGESIALWLTDDIFIDEATAVLIDGHPRVPVFSQVLAGSDFDKSHLFHVAPAGAIWQDAAFEICDAAPSGIDSDVKGWIASVGSWCPFAVQSISQITDCRESGAGPIYR